MVNSAIQLENIFHGFENRTLFENLSLSIADKKITTIQGKSGSGKSTLLQMINGLVRPRAGMIRIFNEPLRYEKIHDQRLKIGYAVQQIGLFPHLSVFENIGLPGILAKWKTNKRKDRILELMQLVSLPGSYKHKYPHQLSGGEQQRVGLCRAIMLNPPVMLLDESFSSLDAQTRDEIHGELLHLQSVEPRCIVMVTHDPNEARKLGDIQVHLEEGVITTMKP